MPMFRKKPVVIEAVQWTGENLLEVIRHTRQHASAAHWKWEEYEDLVRREGLKIFTIEGPLMASIGDWIIKDVKGECYPCKPDIFMATYEAADRMMHPTMKDREDAEKYHRVMELLRSARMEHGLCKPRDRRACTACNAKDDLEKLISEYRGAPVVLMRPNDASNRTPREADGEATTVAGGPG